MGPTFKVESGLQWPYFFASTGPENGADGLFDAVSRCSTCKREAVHGGWLKSAVLEPVGQPGQPFDRAGAALKTAAGRLHAALAGVMAPGLRLYAGIAFFLPLFRRVGADQRKQALVAVRNQGLFDEPPVRWTLQGRMLSGGPGANAETQTGLTPSDFTVGRFR